MSRIEEKFRPALDGKKIPVLTLDNKWHKLFSQVGKPKEILELEHKLNEILKRQGKITTETKSLKKIKSKLMSEIMESRDDQADSNLDKATEKKLANNTRLINEANEKMDSYKDEEMEIPKKISDTNYQLMLATMEACYSMIQDNSVIIDEIAEWISKIRIELKKNVIRKQEREFKNTDIYSYMHDIFGPDVIEIFDMKYQPELKGQKEIKE